MSEFIVSIVLEMLVLTPGAFVIALLKGTPRSTSKIMQIHYLPSLIIGAGIWICIALVIKFAITGCIMCEGNAQ